MSSEAQNLSIGWKMHQAGNAAGAEAIYRQVLADQPGNANAWCYLGIAFHDQRQFEEAVAAYRRALELNPSFPIAWNNLGNSLRSLARHEEALEAYGYALRLKPDYANALRNQGAALVDLDRTDEAKESFRAALAIHAGDLESRQALAVADFWSGQIEEAIGGFRAVLQAKPDHVEAHKSLGMALLLQGNFAAGFAEYAWRIKNQRDVRVVHAAPLWDGSPLAGRTLLLEAEQGMGDTLQFVRYAAEIKRRHGGRVVLACEPPLVPLLLHSRDHWSRSLPGGADNELVIVGQNEDRPPFHLWAPLMSLPGILRHDVANFPRDIPYLAADPERIERWRSRLAGLPGRKIGIAWQGSKSNATDRRRSFSLAEFAPLGQLPSVSLLSLQKGDGSEQLADLTEFHVHALGEDFDAAGGAFLDTAAVMRSLDLVVTADTSIAHLAGALGVPVWVALARVPDWRWGLVGETTPWYPTMRLFRQTHAGDWHGVFEAMARALG